MRYLSLFLVPLISLPLSPVAAAQTAPAKLNLVIVEGDGAINNIRQRTAREPIVQVEDENHKPVAGAVVVFLLPNQGAGATFANGAHSLTVITDEQGRAVARGLRPNTGQGQFQIHVNASFNGQTANTTITQTNAAGAAAGTAAGAGISGKLIAVLIVVGAAAAAGGAYAATHSGGGSSSNASIPPGVSTTITAGAGTVGAPR
ncbi:MAG TPA: hypothetical protein VKF41_01745 [Bryobacteraceae bacterium]|nr:hypothetical protein [Bryobacteraceae bacterium]